MVDFVPFFLGLRDRDFLLVSQGKMAKNRDIFLRKVTTPVPHDKLSPENLINAEITVRGPISGLLNNCTLLDFSVRIPNFVDTSQIWDGFRSGLLACGEGLMGRGWCVEVSAWGLVVGVGGSGLVFGLVGWVGGLGWWVGLVGWGGGLGWWVGLVGWVGRLVGWVEELVGWVGGLGGGEIPFAKKMK